MPDRTSTESQCCSLETLHPGLEAQAWLPASPRNTPDPGEEAISYNKSNQYSIYTCVRIKKVHTTPNKGDRVEELFQ